MNKKSGRRSSNEEVLIAPGPATHDRLDFDSLNVDAANIKEKTITLSNFQNIGFKGTCFEDCAFNHSQFQNCYFRKSVFTRVSLLGCSFVNCRFDEAQFSECQLDYSEFVNCSITYKQIAHTLPRNDNVVRALARNLRVNSQERGQTDDCREFLLVETRATERHNFKKAFERNDKFYKTKYRGWDRWSGFFSWLWLRFNWFFWGHGEAPFRVLLSALVVVLAFSGAYWGLSTDLRNLPSKGQFIEVVGFSIASFTTTAYGDIIPSTPIARWLVTLEGALGLTMFGFLVTALYRRISRR